MKNERDYSVQLMTAMRIRLRGCWVIKHSDRATSGIPDISCSWAGFTFWIEDKLLRKGKSYKDILDYDQLIFCHELGKSVMGRCWVVIYEESPQQVTIWQPRALLAQVFPTLILGEEKHPMSIDPQIVDDNEPINLFNVVQTMGAIRCPGWRHTFILKLISDAR